MTTFQRQNVPKKGCTGFFREGFGLGSEGFGGLDPLVRMEQMRVMGYKICISYMLTAPFCKCFFFSGFCLVPGRQRASQGMTGALGYIHQQIFSSWWFQPL